MPHDYVSKGKGGGGVGMEGVFVHMLSFLYGWKATTLTCLIPADEKLRRYFENFGTVQV